MFNREQHEPGTYQRKPGASTAPWAVSTVLLSAVACTEGSGPEVVREESTADASALPPESSAHTNTHVLIHGETALDPFILGIQWDGGLTNSALPDLGVHWTRLTLSWRWVQPVVEDDSWALIDVTSDPSYVDEYIETADWSGMDQTLQALQAQGVQIFPVVGLGWIGCLPTYQGQTATPDALGADTYLAYMYVYVKALVERYDGDGDRDAPGITIKTWQIENELNQAMLTTLYGWREPTGVEGMSSMWADWDFLTELLRTLNRAVHEADPTAITVQNLHTDIPEEYNHLFRLPGWEEAAVLWKDHMDWIGFDAYPNYYYSDPIHGAVIGERVTLLKDLTNKPVIAMEVGYPSGPTELGYSQEKQAQFLEEAFHSALAAGARGYFHFKLASTETHSVVLTEEDKSNLALVGHLFEDSRIGLLLAWTSRHIDYIPHFIDVLQAVEGYWGLETTAGVPKLSYETMVGIAAEVNQFNHRMKQNPRELELSPASQAMKR